MRKIFHSIATAAIALSFAACGGKKAETAESAQPSEDIYSDEYFSDDYSDDYSGDEEKAEIPASATVTLEETTFNYGGDLAEFVELVAGDYDVKYEDFEIVTSVNVRALAQTDRKVSYITVKYYDGDGYKLASEDIFDGMDALNEALRSGDTATEIKIPDRKSVV